MNLSFGSTISRMFIEANGETHYHNKSNEWVKTWYGLSLSGDTAVLTQCSGYRKSDWLQSSGSLDESIETIARKPFSTNDSALDLPEDALFAFHALDDSSKTLSFTPQRVPSLLSSPHILRNNWSTTVRFQDQTITLKAIGERRRDKRLLAGSLQLLAIDHGDTTVLMEPMAETIFKRQELLWIGDLDGDAHIDALIKRTLHTGETILHFHLGRHSASKEMDEAFAYQVYSAGIEDHMSIGKNRKQAKKLQGIDSFGEKAFTLKSSLWNKTYGNVRGDALPQTLLDYQLKLDDEKVRFTFDYTPRYRGSESSYNMFYGPSPAHVTVHYRGRKQALIDLGNSDGLPIRVQIDTIDNKMAIQIDYWPHYNNSFTCYWIWNEKQKRFVKYMQYHGQGC